MEAVTLDMGQLVLAFVAAMGIPSAVMGFIMWKLERRISKRETEMADREKAQEKLFILIVQSSGAAIALGEATARADRRGRKGGAAAVNQVEMIAALCAIIDQQNVIIQDQATQLAQFDALTHAGEIAALQQKYAAATGGPVDKLEV